MKATDRLDILHREFIEEINRLILTKGERSINNKFIDLTKYKDDIWDLPTEFYQNDGQAEPMNITEVRQYDDGSLGFLGESIHEDDNFVFGWVATGVLAEIIDLVEENHNS